MRLPVLSVATLLLLAACTDARADAPFRQDYRTTEVADGVIAFVADESPGGVVQGNITVIAGERYSVVVDSGQYPALARRIVEDVRARGLPPVKYLVNTHWHGDHLLANHVFKDAWPELVVLQHAQTARAGARNYADWHAKAQGYGRLPDELEAAAARGTSAKGEPLSEEQRAGNRTNAALLRQWLAAGGMQTRWAPPDLTFGAGIDLELGNRTVSVRHLGRANTAGDVVLWDERTRTLVTGDIVVAPTPYSFGSYHSDWIGTLARLRAMKPARIVPGHGQVMGDDAYLQQLAALLEETRRQVRAGLDAGRTLEQLRAEIRLPEFEARFAGTDPARIRAFRAYFLQPGIEQAYKEARGETWVE